MKNISFNAVKLIIFLILFSDYFFQYRSFAIMFCHFTAFMTAAFWILHNYKTIPNYARCSDINNPCSCSSFSVYTQICEKASSVNNSYIALNNTTPIESATTNNSNIAFIFFGVLIAILIIYTVFRKSQAKKNAKKRKSEV